MTTTITTSTMEAPQESSSSSSPSGSQTTTSVDDSVASTTDIEDRPSQEDIIRRAVAEKRKKSEASSSSSSSIPRWPSALLSTLRERLGRGGGEGELDGGDSSLDGKEQDYNEKFQLFKKRGESSTFASSSSSSSSSSEAETNADAEVVASSYFYDQTKAPYPPLKKVLFLSADTGGGHRASAESLGKQLQIYFPGTTYQLLDTFSSLDMEPFKTFVDSYSTMSANQWQWGLFYHLSNNKPVQKFADLHLTWTGKQKMYDCIANIYDPDVIISVHPGMNATHFAVAKELEQKRKRPLPFFTVVTDLGAGHLFWFQPNVEKVYVASETLHEMAKKVGTPSHRIVRSGLPIRHEFAVQAKAMMMGGDNNDDKNNNKDNNDVYDNDDIRMTGKGREYRWKVRADLGLVEKEEESSSAPDNNNDEEKQHSEDTDGINNNIPTTTSATANNKFVVLVMGGGEGVGSLTDIAQALYTAFTKARLEVTICVVCGKNEALKSELETRHWTGATKMTTTTTTTVTTKSVNDLDGTASQLTTTTMATSKLQKVSSLLRLCKPGYEKTTEESTTPSSSSSSSSVKVLPLGFVTRMAEYMVAADILISKAGPGTIAEAASVGLPVLLTDFLPGQEAGNIDFVVNGGFGAFERDPTRIAQIATEWLQGSQKLSKLSSAAFRAGHPDAAKEIAMDIGGTAHAIFEKHAASATCAENGESVDEKKK